MGCGLVSVGIVFVAALRCADAIVRGIEPSTVEWVGMAIFWIMCVILGGLWFYFDTEVDI